MHTEKSRKCGMGGNGGKCSVENGGLRIAAFGMIQRVHVTRFSVVEVAADPMAGRPGAGIVMLGSTI